MAKLATPEFVTDDNKIAFRLAKAFRHQCFTLVAYRLWHD